MTYDDWKTEAPEEEDARLSAPRPRRLLTLEQGWKWARQAQGRPVTTHPATTPPPDLAQAVLGQPGAT